MNPGIAGFLAHERERELARRAKAVPPAHLLDEERDARAGRSRVRPLSRLATWTGLVLVRAGQRLAGIEVLSPRGPHLQRPA